MEKYLHKITNQSGFSLPELITVIVVLGIISLITAGLIGSQTEAYMNIFNRSILNSEGRKTLDRLRIDLHELSPDSISIMQANQLSFTEMGGNTLEYQYVSNEIRRNAVTLVNNVQSAPFSYLDSAMVVTANPANLAFVRVNLNLSINGKTVQLEELIYARN